VVAAPNPLLAAAQEALSLPLAQERVVPGRENLHLELVRVARVAQQRMARHQGADHLLLIGVDEDAGLHDLGPAGCFAQAFTGRGSFRQRARSIDPAEGPERSAAPLAWAYLRPACIAERDSLRNQIDHGADAVSADRPPATFRPSQTAADKSNA